MMPPGPLKRRKGPSLAGGPLPCTEVPSTGQRRPALPRASPAVPSARCGLASGFGMGPGVPRTLWPLTGGRRSAHRLVSRCPGASRLRVPWGPHSEEGRPAPIHPARPRSERAAPFKDAHAWMRVRARAISTARLSTSPCLHLRPIDQVFYLGPYRKGELISGTASRLDAFSGYPRRTRLPGHAVGRQPVHRRSVHPGPLVLGAASLDSPAPAEDRDRTVSRRSEPSSRTALNGEQPYPWDLLQPQDAMSRHRGAKPCRRCGLLGKISLLSPEYLLSVERRPSHVGPPDH